MPRDQPKDLKTALQNELSVEELKHLTTSFDIIGDIAIIEIRPELEHKKELIGKTLLEMHKPLKVVCKRAGVHTGIYRTQKLEVIAGEKRKETTHKESSCNLTLDVEQCYFSIRSGSERLRIVNAIKQKNLKTKKLEDILILFSGIGPYTCVIGKNAPYKTITGAELNPIAHSYAERNIIQNKIRHAITLQGDARKIVKKLKIKYDRIIMPLPRTAEEFLDCAISATKKGTIIHLYAFIPEEEFNVYQEKAISICKKNGATAICTGVYKCGQFSPKLFRVCLDIIITKVQKIKKITKNSLKKKVLKKKFRVQQKRLTKKRN